MTYGLVIALLGVGITYRRLALRQQLGVLLLLPSFVFVAPGARPGALRHQRGTGARRKTLAARCFHEERGRLGDAWSIRWCCWWSSCCGCAQVPACMCSTPDGQPARSRSWSVSSPSAAPWAPFSRSISFAASAFSLPMLLDRRTDGVTAVVTSVERRAANKPAMLVWIGSDPGGRRDRFRDRLHRPHGDRCR